jgi:hypothetical protein
VNRIFKVSFLCFLTRSNREPIGTTYGIRVKLEFNLSTCNEAGGIEDDFAASWCDISKDPYPMITRKPRILIRG